MEKLDLHRISHANALILVENFNISYSLSERVRSFVKVQDGCDYNCSFCTIPMARGKSRSATIDNVLDVTKSLEDKGFNEIVISGINLGDFQNEIYRSSEINDHHGPSIAVSITSKSLLSANNNGENNKQRVIIKKNNFIAI